MRVLISAAETSSDSHAAELLRALRKESHETIDAFGIGGPKLQTEGLRSVFDARELLSMGFVEILGRLPKVFAALRAVEDEAKRSRPDVAVVLDYPDFHFRLARRLSRLGIPLVYYIPPKVWAWRKGRVRFLKRYFKKVLTILPFEEDFYKGAELPAQYVGNPLQDELPIEVSRAEARRQLKLSDDELVLAVLVGSRPVELKRHLEVFLDGAEETARELQKPLRVLLPFAATSDFDVLQERVKAWQSGRQKLTRVEISQGNSGLVMKAADVGLIKSGTSTLEAALLGLPHVIAYRPNEFTCFIVKHLIGYDEPIGLSNLVAGAKRKPYPIAEITCKEVTPQAIAVELVPLFSKTQKLADVQRTIEKVRQAVLRGGESPSLLAAKAVLSVVKETRK